MITFIDEKKCDICNVLAIALIYPRMNIKMMTYNAFMTMMLKSFRVRSLSVHIPTLEAFLKNSNLK